MDPVTHEDDLPPLDPADMPPQLQEALRRMSARGDGPVVDLGTGAVVAQEGRLVTDPPEEEQLVACNECARAIALGWWGAIARHPGPADKPVCVLCGEGQAVLTAGQWFDTTAKLKAAHVKAGKHHTWRDDAVARFGAARPGL
ncbi:hypothetical protein ACFVY4_26720 [Streptomyces sp. NPDC058299]|uniref:hypothetical protein n=1 Tax=Streptomyces sp. NPDC058299 TaxID=3346435 RepID=UPI0036EB65BB